MRNLKAEIEKREEGKMETMKIGQKIYYTGDMANVSDFGQIVKINEPTRFSRVTYNVALDNGRIIRAICEMAFDKSPGQRFKTIEQYNEERKVAQASFQKMKNSLSK